MKSLILVLIFLSGCAAYKGVLLHWPTNQKTSVEYGTYMDKFPEDFDFEVNAVNLINNTQEYDNIVQSLTSVKLPDHMPLITTVSKKNNSAFEVKTISTEPIFEGEPADKEEEMERRIQKEMTGTLQLLGEIDSSGDILSYYLVQRQKNLISLFFKLPGKPVEVGDTWTLPVNLIELGNGYRVDKSQYFNKAHVMSIKNDPNQGSIAEIVYIIVEDLEGSYHLRENSIKEVPAKFAIAATYVAYAEFLIDKGYWKSYTAKLSFTGSGSLSINNSNLHALRPIDRN